MKVTENAELGSFNTFGVKASASLMIEVQHEEEVLSLSAFNPSKDLVLGGGSNILFVDDVAGTLLLNRIRGVAVASEDQDHVYLEVGAGENWHELVHWCVGQGWSGIENLALIPGLSGAAPMQNIGAYGVELESVLTNVTAWDWKTAGWVVLDKKECRLGYRDSLFKSTEIGRYFITSIGLKLDKQFSPQLSYQGLKEALNPDVEQGSLGPKDVFDAVVKLRKSRLPDHTIEGNAGSFFKNPVVGQDELDGLQHAHPNLPHWRMDDRRMKLSAAWMIEQCGLKGLELGGAAVSERHSLVLLNRGAASGAEIWKLAEHVRNAVHNEFGILLMPEPQIYHSSSK